MLNLRRGIGTHEPSVISLGQVWVDIMLNVDEVPAQGGFAVADHPKPSIGGSYRVLQAASRMGVPTEHAGILGNGLWAHFIRQSFQDNGITHIGQDRLDEDSGFPRGAELRRAEEDIHRFLWRRGSWRLGHVRHAGAAAQRRGAHQRQH